MGARKHTGVADASARNQYAAAGAVPRSALGAALMAREERR